MEGDTNESTQKPEETTLDLAKIGSEPEKRDFMYYFNIVTTMLLIALAIYIYINSLHCGTTIVYNCSQMEALAVNLTGV